MVRVRFSDRYRIVQVVATHEVREDKCPPCLGGWVNSVTSSPERLYTVSYEVQVLSCKTTEGGVPILGDKVIYLQRNTGAEIPGTVIKVLSCDDGYVLRVQRGGISASRIEPITDDSARSPD